VAGLEDVDEHDADYSGRDADQAFLVGRRVCDGQEDDPDERGDRECGRLDRHEPHEPVDERIDQSQSFPDGCL